MTLKVKRNCPVCGREYYKGRTKTFHHQLVWPKEWYKGSGPKVETCSDCHREFEKNNPHNYVWTTYDAEFRWYLFCQKKKEVNDDTR